MSSYRTEASTTNLGVGPSELIDRNWVYWPWTLVDLRGNECRDLGPDRTEFPTLVTQLLRGTPEDLLNRKSGTPPTQGSPSLFSSLVHQVLSVQEETGPGRSVCHIESDVRWTMLSVISVRFRFPSFCSDVENHPTLS